MAPGYKFETPQEPPPPTVDDEIRRKEEEELQRVLEMSVQDKGGRPPWSGYSPAAGGSSSSGARASSSNSQRSANRHGTSSTPAAGTSHTQNTYHPAHVPVQPSSPEATQVPATYTSASSPASSTAPVAQTTDFIAVVTRVRALHTFEPTEQGELAFDKGDIIKVVDRGYKDWWRGQLKGRTGIFPVNYVVSPKFNLKSNLLY